MRTIFHRPKNRNADVERLTVAIFVQSHGRSRRVRAGRRRTEVEILISRYVFHHKGRAKPHHGFGLPWPHAYKGSRQADRLITQYGGKRVAGGFKVDCGGSRTRVVRLIESILAFFAFEIDT